VRISLPRHSAPAALLRARAVDETPSHDCRVTMYDKADFGGWKLEVPPGQYMFNELDKKSPWKNDEVRQHARARATGWLARWPGCRALVALLPPLTSRPDACWLTGREHQS
jgi:hypothetical protein